MPGCGCVEQGQPQRRPGDREPGHGHDPAGAAVPGPVVAPEAGHELERTDERETAAPTMCTTRAAGKPAEPVVGRHQLRAAGELDQPQRCRPRAGWRTARPARPGPASPETGRAGPTRSPVDGCRRGWSAGRRTARTGSSDAGAAAGGGGRRWVAPQGDAEADERDALGDGERPVERLRQHRERGGPDGADGQQDGRPAGEDAGAEQGDAEEEAAEQVAGAGQVEQGLQAADVTVRGAAGGGDDDVVDESGLGVDQVGQDERPR